MIDMIKLVLATILSLFRGRARLEAENVVLRHQLNILRRSAPRRLRLSNVDRVLLVWLHRLCPNVLDAIRLVRPETIVRWHRQGFRPTGGGAPKEHLAGRRWIGKSGT